MTRKRFVSGNHSEARFRLAVVARKVLCCALAAVPAGSAFAQEAQPEQASVDANGIQRVNVLGGSYFFKPSKILAKAGQPLELSVRMEQGVVPHRFVLEGSDGKPMADIELGEAPTRVRVELGPGEYTFHCPNRLLMFKSHRERGMAGVLVMRE